MAERSTPVEEHIAEPPPPRLRTDQPVHTVIAGQYRVEERLGDGGMGIVYKCTDLAVDRIVAIKLLHPHLVATSKWFLRFQQEAKAVARLQHPNIIRMHHFSASDDTPFIVMDYVQGRSLSEIISNTGKLSPERSLKIMIQAADALAHAHDNGVVHRDLKPSNILVLDGTDDQVKILDFGIAQLSTDESTTIDPIKLTQTGEVFGSPAYMSPEQCEGKKIDARSDQYSLGCVLFECLTGTPPFAATSSIHVMMQQLNDTPPTLKEASLGQTFPLHLEQTVRTLLNKKPEDRFSEMRQVVRALRDRSGDEQIEPSEVNSRPMQLNPAVGSNLQALPFISQATLPERSRRHHRYSNQLLAGAVVMIVLAIAVVTIHSIMSTRNDTKAVSLAPIPTHVETMIDNSMGPVLELIGEPLSIEDLEKIGKLRQLELLDLGRTDVSNEGMYSLSNLTGLRSLTLDYCRRFDGTGLSRIEKMPNLLQFSARSSNLTDEDLEHLNPHLRYLDLSKNSNITNSGVRNLLRLKNLTFLRLKDCRITEGVEEILERMKSLESLDVSENRMSSTALKRLINALPNCVVHCSGLDGDDNDSLASYGDLHDLERLSHLPLRAIVLDNCQNVQSNSLAKLENMKTLLSLSANKSSISDGDLAYLNPRIRNLSIEGCKITDVGLEKLSRLKNLRRLSLSKNNISDTSLKVICNMKNLQILDVRFNPQLTQRANDRLIKELPHCVIITNPFLLRLPGE